MLAQNLTKMYEQEAQKDLGPVVARYHNVFVTLEGSRLVAWMGEYHLRNMGVRTREENLPLETQAIDHAMATWYRMMVD